MSEDLHLTLTWVRAPLMGFSKDAPPSRWRARVHSRTVSRPSVRRCHSPDSFRPCRSSRLRRFAPRAPCRSVAPCTRSWGSVRFGPWSSSSPRGVVDSPAPPRNRASHPSELSPRRPPYRVTAALALPSFFPTSDCSVVIVAFDRACSTSGLCSADESVATMSVAAHASPLLSWALFPFRVLPEYSSSYWVRLAVTCRSGCRDRGRNAQQISR